MHRIIYTTKQDKIEETFDNIKAVYDRLNQIEKMYDADEEGNSHIVVVNRSNVSGIIEVEQQYIIDINNIQKIVTVSKM